MKKRTPRMIAVLTAFMVLCAGCGTAGASYDAGGAAANDTAAATQNAVTEEYYSFASEAAAADELYEPMEGGGAETLEESAQVSDRKLIKTVDLFVETENYEELIASLEKQIADLDGYIEYQYQYNGSPYSGYDELRNARLEVRIPVERLEEFVVRVGEESNITNKTERVEDVTLRYVDLESRKKALMTQQERLLELLEQAETVEDIIAIEQRLSDVRYELESMESQLRTLNNQIDYSTINLNIEEVRRLTPTQEKSAWDKMKNGFVKTIFGIGDDIADGFIWFVINIPYFILWIILILIALFAGRSFVRRRRRKKEAAETEALRQREGENDHGTEE